jgi:hypothetical protein
MHEVFLCRLAAHPIFRKDANESSLSTRTTSRCADEPFLGVLVRDFLEFFVFRGACQQIFLGFGGGGQ